MIFRGGADLSVREARFMEQVQTWDKMRAWCEELLVRKTGEDVAA